MSGRSVHFSVFTVDSFGLISIVYTPSPFSRNGWPKHEAEKQDNTLPLFRFSLSPFCSFFCLFVCSISLVICSIVCSAKNIFVRLCSVLCWNLFFYRLCFVSWLTILLNTPGAIVRRRPWKVQQKASQAQQQQRLQAQQLQQQQQQQLQQQQQEQRVRVYLLPSAQGVGKSDCDSASRVHKHGT